jgi:hypothetical protein
MRELEQDVWYKVRSGINCGEPVFQLWWAVALFYRVLLDADKRFKFEICELAFDDAWLSFYIKPADGFQLPKIMQWLRQTFLYRFKARTGRGGHLWGSRYESKIIGEEPPPEAKAVDWDSVKAEAAKEIPVDGTYTLSWANYSSAIKLTTRITLKDPATPPLRPDNRRHSRPVRGQKGV